MCPNCRGLIERKASVCPLCGVQARPARARGSSDAGSNRILGIIPIPGTATATLIAVNIALFGISWYLTQVAASAVAGSSPGFGSIEPGVIFRLGGKLGDLYGGSIIYKGQWWRLVTANFLHFGLIHIFMNLWCLIDLGPMAESLFTKAKFVVMYLATGVFGFFLSAWAGRGFSAGASAAVLGLIGVLIGASFHHGRLGKDFRGQLWRWVIYIGVLGIFGPLFGLGGIDNYAHFGGLVSGLLLGYVVPDGEPNTRREEILWDSLATISVLIIAGSFALMALHLNDPSPFR